MQKKLSHLFIIRHYYLILLITKEILKKLMRCNRFKKVDEINFLKFWTVLWSTLSKVPLLENCIIDIHTWSFLFRNLLASVTPLQNIQVLLNTFYIAFSLYLYILLFLCCMTLIPIDTTMLWYFTKINKTLKHCTGLLLLFFSNFFLKSMKFNQ